MALNHPKLIGITSVVDPALVALGIETAEDLVAYCARVSSPQNQTNTATAAKLLKYLRDHKHWSPFEMVNLVFEIETTRDIARQILRHRSFAFQEYSGRYSDMTVLSAPGLRETRLQDLKNRQNSLGQADSGLDSLEFIRISETWEDIQKEVLEFTNERYEEALKLGIAKEQARAILPEGLTASRMYMNGSLRSWIHYCEIRTGVETQKEHRDIACAIQDIILNIFTSLKDIK